LIHLTGIQQIVCQVGKKDVDGAQIIPPDAKPGVRYFVVRGVHNWVVRPLYAVTSALQK
jgi:hypothetical protein